MTDIFQNMSYNTSQLASARTVSDLFNFANTQTSSLLGMAFAVTFFFVCMMVLHKSGFKEPLLTSSFLSFLVSLIMAYGGFVPIIFTIAMGVILVLTGLIIILIGDKK